MKYIFSLIYPLLLFSTSLCALEEMAKADSLFELRDRELDTERLIADTTAIDQAIVGYRNILEKSLNRDEKEEALWKLLQAFYYKGQFGTDDKKQKKEIYSRGIKIGETYEQEFSESVEVNTWLGILWARWAEVYGIFAAARKGVAKKVKQYGEKAVELDDRYLDAGGYRLLGMLHFSVPKIPLLLTWPSKDLALEYLEKAYEIAPQNLYNKMYLTEVLYSANQKERAKTLLLEIIDAKSLVHDRAIDLFIKKQAQEFLDKHYRSN
jgi:tetratricopeptide (TPR) repeat protein